MSIKLLAQCVLVSITGLIPATAAFAIPTYMYDGGGTIVTGINDIDVGGSLWDVAFIDDSVDSYLAVTGLSEPQFDGTDPVDQALVISLHTALSDALTNDLPDLLPTAFNGCTTTSTTCDLITLTTISSATLLGSANGIKSTVNGTSSYPLGFAEILDNSVNSAFNTLTFWTEHTNGTVTEPSVLALMSAGLFGLFGLVSRRQRT